MVACLFMLRAGSADMRRAQSSAIILFRFREFDYVVPFIPAWEYRSGPYFVLRVSGTVCVKDRILADYRQA